MAVRTDFNIERDNGGNGGRTIDIRSRNQDDLDGEELMILGILVPLMEKLGSSGAAETSAGSNLFDGIFSSILGFENADAYRDWAGNDIGAAFRDNYDFNNIDFDAARDFVESPLVGHMHGEGIYLSEPVGQRVSDTFRVRGSHPVHGDRRMHRGTDYAAPDGTELRATEDAEVAYAGTANGYGNFVVLHHGHGVYTMYAHLSRDTVSTGDIVQEGELFAYTGSSGVGTGAHLHQEVWIQDNAGRAVSVNPQDAYGRDLSDQAVRQDLIDEARRTSQELSPLATVFTRIDASERQAAQRGQTDIDRIVAEAASETDSDGHNHEGHEHNGDNHGPIAGNTPGPERHA